MKTKKGRTYEDVVALMKEGAKEERKKIEAARAANMQVLVNAFNHLAEKVSKLEAASKKSK